MLALLIILLIVFAILGGIGFAVKGLVWLAIIGLALFVITGVAGLIRHRRHRRLRQ